MLSFGLTFFPAVKSPLPCSLQELIFAVCGQTGGPSVRPFCCARERTAWAFFWLTFLSPRKKSQCLPQLSQFMSQEPMKSSGLSPLRL